MGLPWPLRRRATSFPSPAMSFLDSHHQHGMPGSQPVLLILWLCAAIITLALASLAIGPAWLSLRDVIAGLWDGSGVPGLIVRDIRLPRTLLAILIGATFGLAGAALQGLLRNPLASPSLFGAPQSAQSGPGQVFCSMRSLRG